MECSLKQDSLREILSVSLLAGIILSPLVLTNSASPAELESQIQFTCAPGFDQETQQYLPTTYAWSQRGKIAVVRWKQEWFKSQNWTPQSRCETVSPRFQEAYNTGTFAYLTHSTQNNQPVICTTRGRGEDCATLLFTLRPEDDAIALTKTLADILRGKGVGPIQHSGSAGKTYYRIDIEEFLRTAPVEKD
jgi:hypothetical protein